MILDYNKLSSDYNYRHKFYLSKEWRATREIILSKQPLCVKCLENNTSTPATDVDHIIDIKINPKLCLTLSNLQPLCHSCHASKTMKSNRDKIHQPYLKSRLVNQRINTELK